MGRGTEEQKGGGKWEGFIGKLSTLVGDVQKYGEVYGYRRKDGRR